MKKIIYTKGDVTKPAPINKNENYRIIIPHCCNDIGVMGAGVALALRKKWPAVFAKYKEECSLGKVSLARVFPSSEDPSCNPISVANMVAQHGVGGYRPLRYRVLIECMDMVTRLANVISKNGKVPEIHAPKFGSDLARGKWDFIEDLIEETWLSHDIDVVIYQF